jgi:hypothetical protein
MTIESENQHLKFCLKQYAIAYMAIKNPMYDRLDRIYKDKIYQQMNNNLFSNNPGEIERWCDDGGR